MKIYHVIPKNTDPSGGIKVHFQLSEIEIELGHDSFVAIPDLNFKPDWFNYKAPVISWDDVHKFLEQDSNALVVGWEDIGALRKFKSRYLVSYLQGEVFFDRGANYDGIQIWYTSEWNRLKTNITGYKVSPFIDKNVFGPFSIKMFNPEHVNILLQERKFGKEKWNEVNYYLSEDVRRVLSVQSLKDVSEAEFARQLRLADIFFAHSFPEGFGLPPLEAMASGTLVIGYTGGGGTDFMVNANNCFICKDGDSQALAAVLSKVIKKLGSIFISEIIYNASVTASNYNKKRTKEELRIAIERTVGS